MQAVLKSTIVNLPEVNLHLFSTLGIIFLCHNMPRTAEIFLEKPKENASKIKFLVFYDGCLKLVKLKASKRTLSRMIGSELKKTIAYFATLKEFRFAVDYLDTLSEIIFNFCDILEPLMENPNAKVSNQNFLNLHVLILKLENSVQCYPKIDSLSASAIKTFVKFLQIIYNFLLNYESLDLYSLRKLSQTLHEFLLPNTNLFSSEINILFRGKKLLQLLDHIIEKKAVVNDSKKTIIKYISEMDLLVLPRSIFKPAKSPHIKIIPGSFVFGQKEIIDLSSFKDHVVDVKVTIENADEKILNHWSVSAELNADEQILGKRVLSKFSLKVADGNMAFKFLCNFSVVADHMITLKLKLVNPLNSVIDEKSICQMVNIK
jgi:hypothetical protein